MELEFAIVVIVLAIIGALFTESKRDFISVVGYTIITFTSCVGVFGLYKIIQNFRGIPF